MKNDQVQKVLDQKVDQIAGVRGVVAVAHDGIALYWTGMDKDAADNRAALGASIGSLAARIAVEDAGGAVRRTMIEMDDGWFLVCRAGQRSYLTLNAKASVDLGALGYELTLLARRLGDVLDAERRQPLQGGAPA